MPESSDTQENALDRAEENLSRNPAVRGADHLVPFGGRMVAEMGQIADDLGEEARRDQQMLRDLDTEFHEQPPVEAVGVDISVIKAVDPEFDDVAFRTIARETFNRVREARSTERVDEADALLSPTMEAELRQEVSGDAAAHRHHLLPGLEVDDVSVVAAAVTAGREVLDVRLTVAGEELERDDATTAVVAGDTTVRRWAEVWRFERDPARDSSETDREHTLRFGDGWLVAHRGWVVTRIQRLPDAPSPPPSA